MDEMNNKRDEKFVDAIVGLADYVDVANTARISQKMGVRVWRGVLTATPMSPSVLVVPPGW
eukprot:1114669-Lingulodinium_polyedra.AAC.1